MKTISDNLGTSLDITNPPNGEKWGEKKVNLIVQIFYWIDKKINSL